MSAWRTAVVKTRTLNTKKDHMIEEDLVEVNDEEGKRRGAGYRIRNLTKEADKNQKE